jgi:hypothetical protein
VSSPSRTATMPTASSSSPATRAAARRPCIGRRWPRPQPKGSRS